MTREEFVAQLERAAAQAAGFPVSQAVFSWTAGQLKRGEPPWWKPIEKAWEKRRFSGTEAAGLYLSALHFDALSDAESPLVRFFPSCGGTAEADPAPGLLKFFSDVPAEFYKTLRERRRRPYVQGRSMLWIAPAMYYFQSRGLPYYLVEVDAGAGLDLAVDSAVPVKGFDRELAAARIGLDPKPLDLTDIAERRWVTASLWPDFSRGIAELDAAIEAAEKEARADPHHIQLVPCPAEKAAAFIAKNVPADDPDVGLMVLNMGATSGMDDEAYAQYSAGMAQLMKAWDDRGLWLEVEFLRGEAVPQTLQQRLFRWSDGGLKSCVMATFDLLARRHSLNKAAEAFLTVAPPKQA